MRMKILYVGEGTYAETIQHMTPSFRKYFPQRRKHILGGLRDLGHVVDILTIKPQPFSELDVREGHDIILTDTPLISISLKESDVFDYIDWYSQMYLKEFGADKNYFLLRHAEVDSLERPKTVIAQGKFNAEHAKKYNSNVVVISNGVDTERFTPKETNNGVLKIVFTGKLNKWYSNILNAVEAVGQMDGVELDVIGGGELEGEIKGRNVNMLGVVPYEEVPSHTMGADICLFTTDDDSPLAIYEYMAAGKPIVTVGGRIEWFLKGRNAILCDGSVEGYKRSLEYLAENPDVRRRMGKVNRRESLQFDWKRLVKEYEQVLLGVLEGEKVLL